MSDIIEQLKHTISENPVILFMKGSPDFPQCGFSMRTAQALKACEVDFVYVDVMASPEVRSNLPQRFQLAHIPPGIRQRRINRRL